MKGDCNFMEPENERGILNEKYCRDPLHNRSPVLEVEDCGPVTYPVQRSTKDQTSQL